MDKDNNSIVIIKDLTGLLDGWFVMLHPSGQLNFYNDKRKIIWKLPSIKLNEETPSSVKDLFILMTNKMKRKIKKKELEIINNIHENVKDIGLDQDLIYKIVDDLTKNSTDDELIKQLAWWPYWIEYNGEYIIGPVIRKRIKDNHKTIPIKVSFKVAREWMFTIILERCKESFNLEKVKYNRTGKRYDTY